MIILNLKKCNNNLNEITKYYSNILNYGYMECPRCKSSNLIKWGSYKRTVKFLYNGEIISIILVVQKVRCKECGHTHALLPSIIVPYKQPALDIILNCIAQTDISYGFDISYDTFCNWKHQFNYFLPYLKTLLPDKINIFDFLLKNIFKIYIDFYKINKKILMMTHKGIYNIA
jgi:transposase-like protein